MNADCNLRGLTPVCSCPRDMTGDPFVRCRPFTKEDLCTPNPCGTNAVCTPGFDRTNTERPVCTCPAGYTGNALRTCVRVGSINILFVECNQLSPLLFCRESARVMMSVLTIKPVSIISALIHVSTNVELVSLVL